MEKPAKKPARKGDSVTMRMTVLNTDGSIAEPALELIATAGERFLPPRLASLENAVVGCREGETFSIVAEDVFGGYDESLIFTVPCSRIPRNLRPAEDPAESKDTALTEGERILIPTDRGELEATILSIRDSRLTLDANHPLAGKKLIFVAEIIKIRR